MKRILAIDPGNKESAYAVVEGANPPLAIDIVPNEEMLDVIMHNTVDLLVIEMVASYGMPVGAEVFETCVWIGRFQQHVLDAPPTSAAGDTPVQLVYRREVKLHHCEDSRAKDGNIVQALVDRFAPGAKNKGKGTKGDRGWFYGFHDDIWQAYALGVYAAEKLL